MEKKTLNLNDIRCVRNRELTDDNIRSMAASIGNTMLLQPIILTKDKKGKLDVVAGRCRYFALQQLQRFELSPDDYKIISNEDAKLISFVENFERRQLSLLEEAEQIGQLLLDHDVAEIATILGRSDKYIRFRANINKLADCWKKALQSDQFPAMKPGHYEVISRFPESVQKSMIKCSCHFREPESIAKFTKELDRKYSRLLLQAPFDYLSCAKCQKRSLQEPWLFEELKDNDSDRCLDPECWDKKIAAFVKKEIKSIEKESANITLIHNEYMWSGDKRYKKALDKRQLQVQQVPADKEKANAFIISGDNMGQYCRIRKNNVESAAPKKPLTLEDKRRQLQSRRVKKAITNLCGFVKSDIDKIPRPADDKLVKMSTHLMVNYSSIPELDNIDKMDAEKMRDKLWKSVLGNIAEKLNVHTQTNLENINEDNGKVVCRLLGLPWEDYIKDATEEIKTPKSLEK